MSKRRLLAISGKRYSGKDTLAALMVAHAARRGLTLETFAFAAESKRMFVAREAARGIEVDLVRLSSDREYKELWRPRLTEFTVGSLGIDPLIFCRAVADRIEVARTPCVITDLRLRLEVSHLRSRFELHVVRLLRSDASRASSGWARTSSVDDHPTETELDDPSLWDETMENDGSLEELDTKAGALLGAQL